MSEHYDNGVHNRGDDEHGADQECVDDEEGMAVGYVVQWQIVLILEHTGHLQFTRKYKCRSGSFTVIL